MQRTLLLSLFVAASLTACDKDHSGELERARANEARAEQKVEGDRNALAVAQAEKREKLAKDQAEAAAKLEREQEVEQASHTAAHRELLATERSKLHQAGVKVAESRMKIEVGAKERLDKIDARAHELVVKTARLKDDAKAKVNDSWTSFEAQHGSAVDAVKTLDRVPDIALASWEKEVDKRITQLDSALSKIERDLR